MIVKLKSFRPITLQGQIGYTFCCHHGRPIAASNGVPTVRILVFVGYFLQPCLARIPSYFRGISDFLKKLEGLPTLSKKALLVTLKVAFLYTNIPDQERVTARKKALNFQKD